MVEEGEKSPHRQSEQVPTVCSAVNWADGGPVVSERS